MSERDRRLFVGLVIFFALIVVGGVGWLARGRLNDMNSRISQAESTLGNIQGMKMDYESTQDQLTKIEEKLKAAKGQDLPAFMEKIAAKVGVGSSLAQVREKGVSEEGNLRERVYSVEINKISLEKLVELLYEAETAGYPLHIRSSTTRAITSGDEKALKATLEVVTWQLLEEEGGDAPEKEDKP